MLRKLLSHAAIYGFAAQVPRVAGIIALPVITPHLTTLDYGVAGVVTAYVVAFNTIHSLGLSTVLVTSYASNPMRYKWIWRQLHGFLSLWGLVFGFVLCLVLWWVIPVEATADRLDIIYLTVLPVMIFGATEFQALFLFQTSQRPFPIAVRSLVAGIITVGVNIYSIAYLQMGYMGWFYGSATGALISFLLYAYPLYFREKMWPIFNFRWHRIIRSLKVSLPVIPHHFSFFMLDTSDRLVMDFLKVPVPRIGLYNIASMFGLYFMAASNAVVQAASPFYMQYLGKKGSDMHTALKARNLTFVLQVIFTASTFILCLWLKEIFILLIRNEDLQTAYPLAIIILMGYVYRPMYLGAVNLLVYRGQTKALWKISTVAGASNIALNLIFIPIFGIEAAAATTFVSLMYMGYSGYTLREYKQVAKANYYPWRWLTANVLALAVVLVLSDIAPIWKLAITFSLTLLGFILGIKYKKQLQTLLNA